ncbi:hypothetical protein ALC57_10649 [Trachymyrmex cornetzi]|uniref:Uncharacterized protein n=1 Tax=Trachymyrmex cornetzi TaxID=471704 RepID=A0A151J3T2_9HYME|nr:hypothetical protein ALC57_10649 [Trachymyrmex cornetzi]
MAGQHACGSTRVDPFACGAPREPPHPHKGGRGGPHGNPTGRLQSGSPSPTGTLGGHSEERAPLGCRTQCTESSYLMENSVRGALDPQGIPWGSPLAAARPRPMRGYML